jgi:hypothetical protein
MVNPNRFYTYAYLREDGTPYYLGKGSGTRIKSKQRNINPPKDKNRIIFLKQNLTEEEAFKHEIYMIFVFGRKDLGTGILHNKTDGGEGPSGYKAPKERRDKMKELQTGKVLSEKTKQRMSEAKSGEKCYWYGKNLSKEHKNKLSESKRGKNNPNFGKKFSDEYKKKLSEAKRKYWTEKKLAQEP